MMSKTHLSVGIASALALTFTNLELGPAVTFIAIAGGALGGITPDIDILDNDYQSDALIGHTITLGIFNILLIADQYFKIGILDSIFKNWLIVIVGIIGYVTLALKTYFSKHRTFSHSILTMILFTLTISMIYTPMTQFYFIGYISHLAIDLLNKSGIQLFYPKTKTYCLNLCYASKTANKVLMYLGAVLSVLLFVFRFIL